MLNQRTKERALLEGLTDALLMGLAFVLAFGLRSYLPLPFLEPAQGRLDFASHFWLLSLSIPLFWMLSTQSGLYLQFRSGSYLTLLWAVMQPFLYLSLMLATAIYLFQAKSFSRAVFFLFLALALVLVVGGKFLLKALSGRLTNVDIYQRNVLIVGLNHDAHRIRRKIEAHPELRLSVVGHLAGAEETPGDPVDDRCLGTLEDLKQIVEDRVVDDVVVALPMAQLVASEQQIAWCEEVGITVHLKVDFVRTLFARTYPSDLDGMPMLTVSSTPHDAASMLIKRSLDLLGGAAGLVLTSPVLLVCALAIKMSSRGPMLFSQERVGLNGRLFKLYKFRSMFQDAEQRLEELRAHNEMSGPAFKMARDPRVTPVGCWLRMFSLDELPQLWNVLRGDMSLVGPRPPLPHEVKRYQRWQRRRLSMKPGITCLWQVNGRSRITSFEEWMRLDLHYIDTWSLKLDLKILLRTVPAVLFAKGAR